MDQRERVAARTTLAEQTSMASQRSESTSEERAGVEPDITAPPGSAAAAAPSADAAGSPDESLRRLRQNSASVVAIPEPGAGMAAARLSPMQVTLSLQPDLRRLPPAGKSTRIRAPFRTCATAR